MRKAYLSAGHTNVIGQDRGAAANGKIEGVEAVSFRDLVATKLRNMGASVTTDSNDSATGKTVAVFSKLVTKNDIAIDFHFDSASDKTATGTTAVLPVPASPIETNIGFELTTNCSKLLKIKNRGLLPQTQTYYEHTLKKKLSWMKLPCNRLIFELCFISNEKDFSSYEANKEELATLTAITIFKFLQR
jgi:N-acetylmuramoyl-L-alanine amidase